MLFSSQLKKTNISEYLLYMWQVEDVLRAFQFDIEKIKMHVIARFNINDEVQYQELVEWYENLIEMMRIENIEQHGHLQINKNTLQDLNEFHFTLLKSNQIPAYNAKFYHILPYLNQLKQKSKPELSDIELCFNFQYGFLLLKMNKQEISTETLKTQREIAKFMVLLNKYYHDYQAGKLELI